MSKICVLYYTRCFIGKINYFYKVKYFFVKCSNLYLNLIILSLLLAALGIFFVLLLHREYSYVGYVS